MNKHGGSSADPPAASLNGERSIIATNPPIFLANGNFRLTAFGRPFKIRSSAGLYECNQSMQTVEKMLVDIHTGCHPV